MSARELPVGPLSADSTRAKTRTDVEALFRRLLQSGRFERFPRNPAHLDAVLAVAAKGVAIIDGVVVRRQERKRAYGELARSVIARGG